MLYTNKFLGDTNELTKDSKLDNNYTDTKCLTVYHGSGSIVEKPSYRFGLLKRLTDAFEPTDLGKGLYLTDSADEAKDWAYIDGNTGRLREGYVMEYYLSLDGLNCVTIGKADVKVYLACLILNRHVTDEQMDLAKLLLNDVSIHDKMLDVFEADVIIAPRLDSKYNAIIDDYLEGVTDLNFFTGSMDLGGLGRQIYLRTPKAFDALEHNGTKSCTDMKEAQSIREKLSGAKDEYITWRTLYLSR